MTYLWRMLGLLILLFTTSLKAESYKREFSTNKTDGKAPLTIIFNASNIKSAKSFHWIFGDGEVTSTNNAIISHTFKKVGIFKSILKYSVKNKNKEKDDDKNKEGDYKDIEKNQQDLKDGGFVIIKVSKSVNLPPIIGSVKCEIFDSRSVKCFQLNTYDPEGGSLNYKFDFGDGAIIDTANTGEAVHRYSFSSNYKVSMVVTDLEGMSSSATTQVNIINLLPVANFSFQSSDFKIGSIINLDASSSFDLDGNIIKYTWQMGDGSFVEGMKIAYQYKEAGEYFVLLMVEDVDGAKSYSSNVLTIKKNLLPTVDFSLSQTGQYSPVQMKFDGRDLVRDDDGFIFGYTWIFNTGEIIKTPAPYLEKDITTHGDFTVRLEVVDNNGGISSKEHSFHINQDLSPVANFTIDKIEAMELEVISFDASTSSDPYGDPLEYTWNFGDGSTDHEIVSAHYYQTAGTYEVSLIVTDLGKNISTIKKSVVIKPFIVKPVAIIGVNENSDGIIYGNLYADGFDSYTEIGTITNYEWDFGDGAVSSQNSLYHAYKENGEYALKLKVTNSLGGISEVTRIIKIAPDNDPTDEYSLAKISVVGLSENKFNPLINLAQFKIDNDLNFNDNSTDFFVEINESTKIVAQKINSKTLQAQIVLKDGKNDISVFARDSEGRVIEESFEVYAGSKTVKVSVSSSDGQSKAIESSIILQENNKIFESKVILDGSTAEFINIPQLKVTLIGKDKRAYYNVMNFMGANLELSQVIEGFGEVSSIDNNDLSQGLLGWSLTGGSYEFENDDIPKLKVKAVSGEEVTLKRTFIYQKNRPFLDFDLAIEGSGLGNEFISTFRNQRTGEILFYTGGLEDLSSTSNGDIFFIDDHKLALESQSGDKIEVFIKLKVPSEEPVGILERFFSAFAMGTPSYLQFKTRGVIDNNLKLNINLLNYSIDKNGKKSYKSFDLFSIGPKFEKNKNKIFASMTLSGLPLQKVYLKGIRLSQQHQLIEKAFMPYSGNIIQLDENGKYQFDSSDINSNAPQFYLSTENNQLSANLGKISFELVYSFSNEAYIFQSSKCGLMFNCITAAKSATILVNHELEEIYRYFSPEGAISGESGHDEENGGDYWVRTPFKKYFAEFKKFSKINLKIGDASKVNGGVFSPHTSGHQQGREVDVQTANMSKLHNFSIKSNFDLKEIFKNESIKKSIDKIYAEPGAEDHVSLPFMQNRCFSGRLGSTFLEYGKPHKSHWHLRFLDNVDKTYKPLPEKLIKQRRLDNLGDELEFEYEIDSNSNETNFYDLVKMKGTNYDEEEVVYDGFRNVLISNAAVTYVNSSGGKLVIRIKRAIAENATELEKYRIRITSKNSDNDCGETEQVIKLVGCFNGNIYEDISIHPNGGGIVGKDAYVSDSVYLAKEASVCNKANITGTGVEIIGKAKIYGNAQIGSNVIVYAETPVEINGNAIIKGNVAIVSGSKVTGDSVVENNFVERSEIQSSIIVDSSVKGIFFINNGRIERSTLQGPDRFVGTFGLTIKGGTVLDSMVSNYILLEGKVLDHAAVSGTIPLQFPTIFSILHLTSIAEVTGTESFAGGNAYIQGRIYGGGKSYMQSQITPVLYRSTIYPAGSIGTSGYANCLGSVVNRTLSSYLCNQIYEDGVFSIIK